MEVDQVHHMPTDSHKTKPWGLLLLFVLSLAGLCYLFLTFPPGSAFVILGIPISYVIIFFILLFLTLYALVAFFLTSALQGVLVGSFIVSLLLFRIINLTHPFFTILLFVLFLCIEAIVWKRK